MKSITHAVSMVVLTAAIGLGMTAPTYAGEPTLGAQDAGGYSVASRTGCHHPDSSKCRRVIHQPKQNTQPVQEKRQSAEPRSEGTRRCLKGIQPHRPPRRC